MPTVSTIHGVTEIGGETITAQRIPVHERVRTSWGRIKEFATPKVLRRYREKERQYISNVKSYEREVSVVESGTERIRTKWADKIQGNQFVGTEEEYRRYTSELDRINKKIETLEGKREKLEEEAGYFQQVREQSDEFYESGLFGLPGKITRGTETISGKVSDTFLREEFKGKRMDLDYVAPPKTYERKPYLKPWVTDFATGYSKARYESKGIDPVLAFVPPSPVMGVRLFGVKRTTVRPSLAEEEFFIEEVSRKGGRVRIKGSTMRDLELKQLRVLETPFYDFKLPTKTISRVRPELAGEVSGTGKFIGDLTIKPVKVKTPTATVSPTDFSVRMGTRVKPTEFQSKTINRKILGEMTGVGKGEAYIIKQRGAKFTERGEFIRFQTGAKGDEIAEAYIGATPGYQLTEFGKLTETKLSTRIFERLQPSGYRSKAYIKPTKITLFTDKGGTVSGAKIDRGFKLAYGKEKFFFSPTETKLFKLKGAPKSQSDFGLNIISKKPKTVGKQRSVLHDLFKEPSGEGLGVTSKLTLESELTGMSARASKGLATIQRPSVGAKTVPREWMGVYDVLGEGGRQVPGLKKRVPATAFGLKSETKLEQGLGLKSVTKVRTKRTQKSKQALGLDLGLGTALGVDVLLKQRPTVKTAQRQTTKQKTRVAQASDLFKAFPSPRPTPRATTRPLEGGRPFVPYFNLDLEEKKPRKRKKSKRRKGAPRRLTPSFRGLALEKSLKIGEPMLVTGVTPRAGTRKQSKLFKQLTGF